MPRRSSRDDLPSTLQRSPAKAQRTYEKTLRNAKREYGAGERAQRTAFASLKHSFEKVGDRWQPKARRGPSDAQAAQSGTRARSRPKPTAGGVDTTQSRAALYARARDLGIPGRSSMSREDLARAISKKSR